MILRTILAAGVAIVTFFGSSSLFAQACPATITINNITSKGKVENRSFARDTRYPLTLYCINRVTDNPKRVCRCRSKPGEFWVGKRLNGQSTDSFTCSWANNHRALRRLNFRLVQGNGFRKLKNSDGLGFNLRAYLMHGQNFAERNPTSCTTQLTVNIIAK